jgi:germination protein M
VKRFPQAVLIFFIAFILVGCSAQAPDIETTPTSDSISPSTTGKMFLVYYIKDGFLTPITYCVEAYEPQVTSALNQLFSGITPEGFENKLTDVKLNSLNISGDTVSLDVSGEFLQGDRVDLAKSQIVYTLTECENIFKVNITVEGEPYEILLERPPFINLKNPEEYEKDKSNPLEMSKYLTIYYADKNKEYLIPVTIKSDKIESETENSDKRSMVKVEDKARAALQHLIEGTSKIESLETLDVKMIKSLRLDDGIAVVDLDKTRILIDFGTKTQYAEIAVESVVRTLTSIGGIEKVQFLVGGVTWGNVTGDLSLKKPIEPDRWYNILTD